MTSNQDKEPGDTERMNATLKRMLNTPPLGGIAPADDHRTYVGGPCAGYVIPPMMRRKFVGDASGKVVRLSDIYRIPAANGAPIDAVDCEVVELVV